MKFSPQTKKEITNKKRICFSSEQWQREENDIVEVSRQVVFQYFELTEGIVVLRGERGLGREKRKS